MVGGAILAVAAVMAGLVPATSAETSRVDRGLCCAGPVGVAGTSPSLTNAGAGGTLETALAARFRAMDAAGQGIFNEDVSNLVAPYFPPGLTLGGVAEMARRQGLGPLRPFKGHVEAGMAATYVTELDLADSGMSNVFVAVYLVFAKENDALVLRRATAYLRASDM